MSLLKWFAWLLALGVIIVTLDTLTYETRKVDPTRERPQDIGTAGTITERYDSIFRKYTRTYFGRMPWRWFKAQAIKESNLQVYAESPVGAMGLMQIMPATFQEIRGELGLPNTPFDPETNIKAGIHYNLKCFNFWVEDRSFQEQLKLMFASYNAGPGNILRAQNTVRQRNLCDGKHWDCIQLGLPEVTGRHSKETIHYVDRIEDYYAVIQ
ncbi:MAG: transglycosylase SLT domain-containing protein [Opitutaceae bacterium]|nr:transglycosylase SLT domain-containing protein [Opitutaceae bacterium]